MTKVNFSKVEKSFEKALEELLINELSELAIIADAIQDPKKTASNQAVKEIISRFQKELKRIKEKSPLLFQKLALSPEVEKRFFTCSPHEFVQKDWIQLKAFKLRLDELKRELHGEKLHGEELDRNGVPNIERKNEVKEQTERQTKNSTENLIEDSIEDSTNKNSTKNSVEKENDKNETEQELIEKERRRHINKRFNVREGWLPLR